MNSVTHVVNANDYFLFTFQWACTSLGVGMGSLRWFLWDINQVLHLSHLLSSFSAAKSNGPHVHSVCRTKKMADFLQKWLVDDKFIVPSCCKPSCCTKLLLYQAVAVHFVCHTKKMADPLQKWPVGDKFVVPSCICVPVLSTLIFLTLQSL